MKNNELTMVTGSLYYKAIILGDGHGGYFLRVMDDNGFWSQREISQELAEEVINGSDKHGVGDADGQANRAGKEGRTTDD